MQRAVALMMLAVAVTGCSAASADPEPAVPSAIEPASTTITTTMPDPTTAPKPATQALTATSTTSVVNPDGGPAGSATGVVVAVDGDLAAINSFAVLLGDGLTLLFVPQEGLLFDDSGPLSHVRDHFVSGAPVSVEFDRVGEVLVATAVGDAE